MKKSIYILGIVLINLLLIGVIFKINHWAGANVAIMLSFVLMVFLFFPLGLISSYNEHKDKSQRHLYIVGYIALAVDFLGMLFKINHWPGANWFMIIGIPIPFVLFLPLYIRYHNKVKAKSDRNFFAVIFFMVYLAVVSSFLALDYSKAAYESNIMQIDKWMDQAENFESKNTVAYQEIVNQFTDESEKEMIDQLLKSGDELYALFGEAKKEIIIRTHEENTQVDYLNVDTYYKIKNLGNAGVSLSFTNSLDNSSGTNLFLNSFNVFDEKLEKLTENVNSVSLNKKELDDLLILLKRNMYKESFYSRSLIANLSALSLMQNRIRFVEYLVLSDLSN